MAAVPSTVGKTYYAKEPLLNSSERSDADGWLRSPEDWSSSAAAAYEGGSDNASVAREREDDEDVFSQAGLITTILGEIKSRLLFFANLALKQLAY